MRSLSTLGEVAVVVAKMKLASLLVLRVSRRSPRSWGESLSMYDWPKRGRDNGNATLSLRKEMPGDTST